MRFYSGKFYKLWESFKSCQVRQAQVSHNHFLVFIQEERSLNASKLMTLQSVNNSKTEGSFQVPYGNFKVISHANNKQIDNTKTCTRHVTVIIQFSDNR